MVNRRYVETPSGNPIYVYQNGLVALDAAKGINNGEPFLHAAWIGAAAPSSGETIVHVGAGTGYYTAILSLLALPNGRVKAYEIDASLAERAIKNLEPFEGVDVSQGDATQTEIPDCDLIYVNAGVVAPPAVWLKALRPGGRIIFPWSPSPNLGITLMLTRGKTGLQFVRWDRHGLFPVSAHRIQTVASRCRAFLKRDRSRPHGSPKIENRTTLLWAYAGMSGFQQLHIDAKRRIWGRFLPSLIFKLGRSRSANSAFSVPFDGEAMIGGEIAQSKKIGGFWRAETDETENYIYAIAF